MSTPTPSLPALDGGSTRRTGPSLEEGLSAIFLGINRNKRSIVLDLKRAEAMSALHRLLSSADVFMPSIRSQKMKRPGLDADTLEIPFAHPHQAGDYFD